MVIIALLSLAGRALATKASRVVVGTVMTGVAAKDFRTTTGIAGAELFTAEQAALLEQDAKINRQNVGRTAAFVRNVRAAESTTRGRARSRELDLPFNESEISLGGVVLLVQQLLRIMNKAVRSKRLRGIFSLVANNEVRAWIVCTRDLIRAIEKGL